MPANPAPDHEALRDWFRRVEYNPRTLAVSTQTLVFPSSRLGSDARVFFEVWTEREGVGLSWAEFYQTTWAARPRLVDDYHALPDHDKAAILALATFPLHEMTHHVDLLTTPYGARFHGECFREYARFEGHAAEDLVALLPGVTGGVDPPLRGAVARTLLSDPAGWEGLFRGSAAPAARARRLAEGLRPRLSFFETARGSVALPRTPGWAVGGTTHTSLTVLGVPISPLTVGPDYYTFSTGPESYLNAVCLLEARAMANVLAWLVYAFGDEAGVREAARYVTTFYPRDDTPVEYLFLLDVFARVVSPDPSDTFHTLLPRLDPRGLLRITGTLSACCWYALHALPHDGLPPTLSSPPVRVLMGLRQVQADAAAGARPAAGVEETVAGWFARIDAGCGPSPSGPDLVRETVAWLDRLIETNDRSTQDPAMQGHFAAVLGAVRWHHNNRGGYGTPPGLAFRGLPFPGPHLSTGEEHKHLLLGYAAPEEVGTWNVLRDRALTRYPAPDLGAALEARFRRRELTEYCLRCLRTFTVGLPAFTRPLDTRCPGCGARHTLDPSDAIPVAD